MDCIQARKLISEYADGALGGDQAWRMQMHLSVCSGCAAELAELRKTVDLLQGLAPKTLSASFDDGLASRISALGPQRLPSGFSARLLGWIRDLDIAGRGRRAWTLGSVSTAAALVVIVLAVQLQQPFSHGLNGSRVHSSPAESARSNDLAASDLAFVAACSSQNARYQSSVPLADPSAQTVAARMDAVEEPAAPGAEIISN